MYLRLLFFLFICLSLILYLLENFREKLEKEMMKIKFQMENTKTAYSTLKNKYVDLEIQFETITFSFSDTSKYWFVKLFWIIQIFLSDNKQVINHSNPNTRDLPIEFCITFRNPRIDNDSLLISGHLYH